MTRWTRNTPIFIALVTYAEIIKEAQPEDRSYKMAINKYGLGLVILDELQQLWQASSWAYSLFKFLADKDFSPLRKLPRASQWQSPAPSEPDIPGNHCPEVDPHEGFSFESGLLQEMNPFFSDRAQLDAMLSNDLFDPQIWYPLDPYFHESVSGPL